MTKPRYYHIDNLHCSSCVTKIENALKSIPEIEQASVNFADNSLMVIGTVSDMTVINTLKNTGYSAHPKTLEMTEEHHHAAINTNKIMQQFLLALIFGGMLMISDTIHHFIPMLTSPHGQIIWLGIGLLCLIVMLISGSDIYQGAWNTLLHKTADMNSLIALGTGAAWFYSMVVVLLQPYLPAIAQGMYFDTAVLIIGLVKLGNWLEARARGKTSAAIQYLLDLQPKTATVILDQQETIIPISEIKIGMKIRIRPGEKIPVDGVIVEGETSIDQSMLTGESMPVKKLLNDPVIGGTLNKSGAFIYKVTQVGDQTTIAKIVDLVRQAQSSKPAIGRLVDKIAAVFVPIVLVVAVITGVIWYVFGPAPSYLYAFITAITVLVIACPCALGLGTPMSLMIGIGNAARHGILIRNGDALQTSGQIDTVVLDKTGTITQGNPAVTQVFCYENNNPSEVIQLAASAEKNSEHPLAEAIIAYAANQKILPATTFNNFPGQGIIATVNDKQVMIGNETMMQQYNINLSVASNDRVLITTKAATPVFVAIDNVLAGLFGISDPIKADSKSAISALQKMGLTIVMLTGDHQNTAEVIANELGIADFVAQCLPEKKHAVIAELQRQRHIVAMVGDGINDAPALTQANVGFAIGAGTDVAIESSDVTLIGNSLQLIVEAIQISKATMRNIKQNLFGAFIYNVLSIPIAAGILYPAFGILLHPIIAAAAMAASSITIVLNANRLRIRARAISAL